MTGVGPTRARLHGMTLLRLAFVFLLVSTSSIGCDNSRLVLTLDDTFPTSANGAALVPTGSVVTAALYDLHTGFVTEGFACTTGASITSSDPSVLWIEPGWRAGPPVPHGVDIPKRVALRAMRDGRATLRGSCNGEWDTVDVEVTSSAIVSTVP